jgi:cytochrome c peroxidase
MITKIIIILLIPYFIYSSTTPSLKQGKSLYLKYCISCHGVNGDGKNVILDSNARRLNKTLLNINQIIKTIKISPNKLGAYNNIMPSFKDTLSHKEISSIALYVKSKLANNDDLINNLIKDFDMSGKNYIKMMKESKKIYDKKCFYCHGDTGNGDGIATLNPTKSIYPKNLNKILLNKKQIFLIIKHGAKHFGATRDVMMSWNKKMDNKTISYLSHYIASKFNRDNKKWIKKDIVIPKNNPLTTEKIKLGKKLFFDKRLSKKSNISCASCHQPSKGWAMNTKVAKGTMKNTKGGRNSPTVLNTAYNKKFFWDGRAKSLEDQALGPIQDKNEMNMKLKDVIKILNSDKEYIALFSKAFPNKKIDHIRLSQAIASFERTIVSKPNSPFDDFIAGDINAISESALRGFELFKTKGSCVDCHDGFTFSDGSFHNIGLDDDDTGRYNVKKRASWYHAFKTPTLRDVTKTAPYFHDGSTKTLKEATKICSSGGKVKNMRNKSTFMIDRKLNDMEINDIVNFIKTLEDKSNTN